MNGQGHGLWLYLWIDSEGWHTQCLFRTETYKVEEDDRYVKLLLFFPCVYYVSYS